MRKLAVALAALLLLAGLHRPALAQNMSCATQICSKALHYLSTASTNATSVKATPGALYSVVAVNTSATVYYLKLYDKATAPTCASDTVVQTYPVPPNTAYNPVVIPFTAPVGFQAGIGFCLTGGIADNDNTNAATGVAINLVFR